MLPGQHSRMRWSRRTPTWNRCSVRLVLWNAQSPTRASPLQETPASKAADGGRSQKGPETPLTPWGLSWAHRPENFESLRPQRFAMATRACDHQLKTLLRFETLQVAHAYAIDRGPLESVGPRLPVGIQYRCRASMLERNLATQGARLVRRQVRRTSFWHSVSLASDVQSRSLTNASPGPIIGIPVQLST